MKRACMIVGLAFFALLAGCSKEEYQERNQLKASAETFVYAKIETTDCMTVDENGLLYTCVWKPEEVSEVPSSEYVYRPDEQHISVYDLEGNCIASQVLEFGDGTCNNMLLSGNTLFCVVSHAEYNCPVLFAIDIEQWTVAEVVKLVDFQSMSYMELLDGYLYFLGLHKEDSAKKDFDNQALVFRYNRIARISVEEKEPELELMLVELPAAIYRTKQDTLMIYKYINEEGFVFLEFNQKDGTIAEKSQKYTDRNITDISGCDKGYLYTSFQNDGNYLYYGTLSGTESQVYPHQVRLNCPVVYQGGFAFFYNTMEGNVCRICIDNIVQENEPLCFLQPELSQDLPYGCGFQMEKQEVTAEELALKVLAQDRDFDLFLLSSRSSVSDSIRKNGVFYTLNEVDGVEEYLNACFPYLNELARNADGDIWMVPVMLAIPGIVYNREYCKTNGVDMSSMDFNEFLNFTEKIGEINPSHVDISGYVCQEELFGQYLSKYDSFDTDLFRKYAGILKSIYAEQWGTSGIISDSISYDMDIGLEMENRYPLQTKGELPEFYYFYNVYSQILRAIQKNAGAMEEIGMLGVPKLEADMKNYGTLTFMAVNPQSENLEATLEYISAFSKYMLTKKDSFLLADESMYTDTPFTKDWYELYANGTVYFDVEGEVFWNTFNDYLNGTTDLETAIAEMERRRKLYLGE